MRKTCIMSAVCTLFVLFVFSMTGSANALFDAVNADDIMKVEDLVASGVDINTRDEEGLTPLMHAAQSNAEPSIIRFLLETGANINARDREGASALMKAARFNSNPHILYSLLEAGADVNAKDQQGRTPLAHAARANVNPKILTILIEAGAEVDARNNNLGTPLIAAVDNKNPEIAAVLVEAGGDVNARDGWFGRTPLMYAAWNYAIWSYYHELDTSLHDNSEVIKTLLALGADGTLKSGENLTAFDYVNSLVDKDVGIVNSEIYWLLNDAQF